MNRYLLYLLDFIGLIGETPIQLDYHVQHFVYQCKYMTDMEVEAIKENYTRGVYKLMKKKYVPYIGTREEWESTLPKFKLWNEDV